MGEQDPNPTFLFTSALSEQKAVCSVLQVFSYSKPSPPYDYLILSHWVVQIYQEEMSE